MENKRNEIGGEEIMWVTTIGTKDKTFKKEINSWLFKRCEEDESTITVYLNSDTIDKIDNITDNRSQFIRQRIKDLLMFANGILTKPHFVHRSEMVRFAIDLYFLRKRIMWRFSGKEGLHVVEVDPIEKKGYDWSEHPADKFLRENGRKIIRRMG